MACSRRPQDPHEGGWRGRPAESAGGCGRGVAGDEKAHGSYTFFSRKSVGPCRRLPARTRSKRSGPLPSSRRSRLQKSPGRRFRSQSRSHRRQALVKHTPRIMGHFGGWLLHCSAHHHSLPPSSSSVEGNACNRPCRLLGGTSGPCGCSSSTCSP